VIFALIVLLILVLPQRPLPNWLSDALCRLATGGCFGVRQLYIDDEEMLFEAARPILLNGRDF